MKRTTGGNESFIKQIMQIMHRDVWISIVNFVGASMLECMSHIPFIFYGRRM